MTLIMTSHNTHYAQWLTRREHTISKTSAILVTMGLLSAITDAVIRSYWLVGVAFSLGGIALCLAACAWVMRKEISDYHYDQNKDRP